MQMRTDTKTLKELETEGYTPALGVNCQEGKPYYERQRHVYDDGSELMEIRCAGGTCHVFAVRGTDGSGRLATPAEMTVLAS